MHLFEELDALPQLRHQARTELWRKVATASQQYPANDPVLRADSHCCGWHRRGLLFSRTSLMWGKFYNVWDRRHLVAQTRPWEYVA